MQILLIIAIVSALAGFGGGWKIQDWRCEAKENARVAAEAEGRKMKEKTATTASTNYEVKKEKLRIKYVKTTEYVDRFIDRPVYKNVCMDEDGLKAINEAMEP